MKYIPSYQIQNSLEHYYQRYRVRQTIPNIIKELVENPDYICDGEINPIPEFNEAQTDENFIQLFALSHFPLDRFLRSCNSPSWRNTEAIFLRNELLHVFKHWNYSNQISHVHDYFEINYVFRGNCILNFEKNKIEMKEGDVCIIAPLSNHELIINDSESFVLNIVIKKEAFESAFMPIMLHGELIATYLRTILYQKNRPNFLYIPTQNTTEMKQLMKQIIYDSRIGSIYASSRALNRLGIFFCTILEAYQHSIHIYNNGNQTLQTDQLTLLQYIQNNYLTITLDSVARNFNYNKTYLSRLITKLTGKPFSQTITELKLLKACELLQYSNYKIEEIAETCGYQTLDYFSKTFKKHYHISPSTYRKNSTVQI